MIVGAGKIRLRLYGVSSLKEKRKIVKSMIQRIRNRFNISVAEIGSNDSHDWAEIGFSITGNETGFINSKIDKVFNMADDMGLGVIADTDFEILHL